MFKFNALFNEYYELPLRSDELDLRVLSAYPYKTDYNYFLIKRP